MSQELAALDEEVLEVSLPRSLLPLHCPSHAAVRCTQMEVETPKHASLPLPHLQLGRAVPPRDRKAASKRGRVAEPEQVGQGEGETSEPHEHEKQVSHAQHELQPGPPPAVHHSLDDLPVATHSADFAVPEQAAPTAVEDTSLLPLASRLAHSKPAERKQAYAELSVAFVLGGSAGEAAVFDENLPQLKGILMDGASLCHDSALGVALAFTAHAPTATVTEAAAMIATVVVDKHLPGSKQAKALDVILSLVEAGAVAHVQRALIGGAAHRAPKTRAAAVRAIAAALHAFGHVLDTKSLLDLPATLVEHGDKGVRDAGAALVGELRRLRGEAYFKEMKGLSEKRVAWLAQQPTPEVDAASVRRVRGGAEAGSVVPAAADVVSMGNEGAGEAPSKFELLSKLPRSRGSTSADKWLTATAATRWQDRKGAADLVHDLLDGKLQLVPADYTELVGGLRRLLSDANSSVVASAARAIGAVARTLSRDFARHARKVRPAMPRAIPSLCPLVEPL